MRGPVAGREPGTAALPPQQPPAGELRLKAGAVLVGPTAALISAGRAVPHPQDGPAFSVGATPRLWGTASVCLGRNGTASMAEGRAPEGTPGQHPSTDGSPRALVCTGGVPVPQARPHPPAGDWPMLPRTAFGGAGAGVPQDPNEATEEEPPQPWFGTAAVTAQVPQPLARVERQDPSPGTAGVPAHSVSSWVKNRSDSSSFI